MIITQEVNMFREAARHLWNSYMRINADWNTADAFREITSIMFKEKILAKFELNDIPIPVDSENDCISQYRIFMKGTGKLPVFVNRDCPPSGYWDYPIDWIPPEMNHDIRPICFFDYDILGWRILEYYRVRIVKCASHSELTGRDALIRCDYVDIEMDVNTNEDGP